MYVKAFLRDHQQIFPLLDNTSNLIRISSWRRATCQSIWCWSPSSCLAKENAESCIKFVVRTLLTAVETFPPYPVLWHRYNLPWTRPRISAPLRNKHWPVPLNLLCPSDVDWILLLVITHGLLTRWQLTYFAPLISSLNGSCMMWTNSSFFVTKNGYLFWQVCHKPTVFSSTFSNGIENTSTYFNSIFIAVINVSSYGQALRSKSVSMVLFRGRGGRAPCQFETAFLSACHKRWNVISIWRQTKHRVELWRQIRCILYLTSIKWRGDWGDWGAPL